MPPLVSESYRRNRRTALGCRWQWRGLSSLVGTPDTCCCQPRPFISPSDISDSYHCFPATQGRAVCGGGALWIYTLHRLLATATTRPQRKRARAPIPRYVNHRPRRGVTGHPPHGLDVSVWGVSREGATQGVSGRTITPPATRARSVQYRQLDYHSGDY